MAKRRKKTIVLWYGQEHNDMGAIWSQKPTWGKKPRNFATKDLGGRWDTNGPGYIKVASKGFLGGGFISLDLKPGELVKFTGVRQ